MSEIISNIEFKNRVENTGKEIYALQKLYELPKRSQHYYDGNIKSAIQFNWSSDLCSHYKRKAQIDKMHVERLTRYINLVAMEIHL